MRLDRARYVTVCQQSLVTAVVVAVAASAAGVRTLDIVPSTGDRGAQGATDGGVATAATVSAEVATTTAEPDVTEVPVDGAAPAGGEVAGQPLVAQSAPTDVSGFATVGVTWEDAPDGGQYAAGDVKVQVRTQSDGAWSTWQNVEYRDEHAPDDDEAAKASERPGTDAVVVGDVDQVQMRAATADGTVPQDLELAVIDPGAVSTETAKAALAPKAAPAPADDAAGATDGASAEPAATGEASATLSAAAGPVAPQIFSRAQWGADERLRSGTPSYGSIRAGFVHHTVNANDYSAEQVPALIRGIYAYHTQSRGWSDIGYNFLVDRFGRIWEGRAGGVDRAVVGAHTSGYNSQSFAMSAIGNFEVAAPPQAVVDAYSRLFAWKLAISGVNAQAGGIVMNGRAFNAVNGHRDAGSTACPGRYLYAKIPEIRAAAAAIQAGGAAAAPAAPPPVYDAVVRTKGQWRSKNLVAAVGDVTGDGLGDVVSRGGRDRKVRIHAGLGNGQVRQNGVVTRPAFVGVKSIGAAGDWNGDGRGDLIVKMPNNRLVVWFGQGGNRFVRGVLLSWNWSAYRSTQVTGDVNGDGVADVAALTGNRVDVFAGVRGGGMGAMIAQVTPPGGATALTTGAGASADVTGDGAADLVVRTPAGTTVLPRATGGALGPFATPGLRSASAANMTGGPQADLVGVSNGQLVVVRHSGQALR